MNTWDSKLKNCRCRSRISQMGGGGHKQGWGVGEVVGWGLPPPIRCSDLFIIKVKFNNVKFKDAYPLPHIQDIVSGYYQIGMGDSVKQCSLHTWVCSVHARVMRFGLCGAPAIVFIHWKIWSYICSIQL